MWATLASVSPTHRLLPMAAALLVGRSELTRRSLSCDGSGRPAGRPDAAVTHSSLIAGTARKSFGLAHSLTMRALQLFDEMLRPLIQL